MKFLMFTEFFMDQYRLGHHRFLYSTLMARIRRKLVEVSIRHDVISGIRRRVR